MDLEHWYYVGELVGVTAVVVSLIYVAAQLRQNAASTRDAASMDYSARINELNIAMCVHREFAEVWSRGASRFDELDEVDQLRLLTFEFGGLNSWRRTYDLYRQGRLSKEIWGEQLGGIAFLSRRQSVQRAWEVFGPNFGVEFQTLMDQHIASQSDPAAASPTPK